MIRVLLPLFVALAARAADPRIETFPVPAGHLPTEIGRHGDVMTFVSWKNWPSIEPHLGRVTTKGKMQFDALAKDHMPGFLSQSKDGTLWLSDGKKTVLWQVSPSGKSKPVTIGRTTVHIAVDADGSIWATHPESGDITRYSANGEPQSQWFVGRKRGPAGGPPPSAMTVPQPMPSTGTKPIPKKKKSDRSLTREERKKRSLDARPSWIVFGSDGALWFSEPTWRHIGRMTASGQTSTFRLPREWGEPGRVIAGPDGALWFGVTGVPVVGRITTAGEITSVDVPFIPGALASDAKGRIWFTDAAGSEIAYLDPDRSVHQLPAPAAPRLIRSMAEGPDGAMWFADQKARVIGRIVM